MKSFTIEVSELISNLILHSLMEVLIYPSCDSNKSMLVKFYVLIWMLIVPVDVWWKIRDTKSHALAYVLGTGTYDWKWPTRLQWYPPNTDNDFWQRRGEHNVVRRHGNVLYSFKASTILLLIAKWHFRWRIASDNRVTCSPFIFCMSYRKKKNITVRIYERNSKIDFTLTNNASSIYDVN